VRDDAFSPTTYLLPLQTLYSPFVSRADCGVFSYPEPPACSGVPVDLPYHVAQVFPPRDLPLLFLNFPTFPSSQTPSFRDYFADVEGGPTANLPGSDSYSATSYTFPPPLAVRSPPRGLLLGRKVKRVDASLSLLPFFFYFGLCFFLLLLLHNW